MDNTMYVQMQKKRS